MWRMAKISTRKVLEPRLQRKCHSTEGEVLSRHTWLLKTTQGSDLKDCVTACKSWRAEAENDVWKLSNDVETTSGSQEGRQRRNRRSTKRAWKERKKEWKV